MFSDFVVVVAVVVVVVVVVSFFLSSIVTVVPRETAAVSERSVYVTSLECRRVLRAPYNHAPYHVTSLNWAPIYTSVD